jgi:anti-sigma regulatory factor (Ser/Thr protein kinase)
VPETLDIPPAASLAYACWLPRHPKSARRARELLREFLGAADGAELIIPAAELVATELVSNAVKHAGEPRGRLIQVRLEALETGLRIEVHDASREMPVLRPRAPGDSESGLGLHVVQSLATSWGFARREYGIGKVVWALVTPEGSGWDGQQA